jgi:hypothetical protein
MDGNEEVMRDDRNIMDCAQFEDIVHELDRPGTQGAQLREIALTHAETCGRCAVLLTESESLDFALVKFADETGRNLAPPRIEAALLQEFRVANSANARRRVRRQIAAIGVAAALFLALGSSLRHRLAPPVADSGSATVENASAAVAGGSVARSHQETQLEPDASSTRGSAANSTEDAEFAEDFTPLPYADDPSMQEGGAVVRVILSRSALESFGVAVSDMGSSERIPADLVVSADGTPEAIRLVSQNVN